MAGNAALLREYFKISVKTVLSYKISFWMVLVVRLVTDFSAFAGLLILFNRFKTLGGWSFNEVLLLYSVTEISFIINAFITRGFMNFTVLIRNGGFDRLLLYPRNLLVQIIGSGLEAGFSTKIIRMLIILSIALYYNHQLFDTGKMFVFISAVAGGVLLYFGVSIIGASVSFFTIGDGVDLFDVLISGTRDVGSYPFDIFAKPLKIIFKYVVPVAFVSYMPVCFILDRYNNFTVALCAPLASLLFLIIARCIWALGLRHYTSSGN